MNAYVPPVDDKIACVVTSLKVSHVKCARCFRYHLANLNYDCLCNRCINIILNHFPQHASVPFILNNLKSRGLTPQDNPESI